MTETVDLDTVLVVAEGDIESGWIAASVGISGHSEENGFEAWDDILKHISVLVLSMTSLWDDSEVLAEAHGSGCGEMNGGEMVMVLWWWWKREKG